MKLYISDLHFFHENLIKGLDKRPFETCHEMNKYIIEKWNSKVKGGDQVIVLGDMFWSKDPDEINPILRKLNGKIYLIKGNHDHRWLNKEGIDMDRFQWIKHYAELDDHGYNVIVSHYPVFCYNHQYIRNEDGSPRTYMLYGHVHNSHDEVLINQFQELTRRTILQGTKENRTIPCNMINCFCMFSDYTPLSLEEWIEVDKKRRATMTAPLETEQNQIIKDEF